MKKLICLIIFFIIVSYAQQPNSTPTFIIKASEDAAKQIEEENGIINDTILVERVKAVVQKVMQSSDIRMVFKCKILNSDVINAFALPAGPIYVTSGLLIALDSLKTEETQSMLAGIVGHEVAHIYLRHSVALMRLENFVKGESIIIPDDFVEILKKGYTREQEFEADEYGIIYAMRAGYDFESIIKFYKRIRELLGDIAPGDEKYNDHPRLTERIAHLYEIRAQIERDFDQWYFGVEALNEGRYNDAINYFRLFTTTFSNSAWGWANLATAYLFEGMSKMELPPVLFMTIYYTEPDNRLRGEPEELLYAEEAFKKALELDSAYNIVYYSNMGIIYALRKEHEKAIELTKKALEVKKAEHIFYNNLGNILFLKRNYTDAIELYEKAIDINPNWPMPKHNLAIAYEAIDRKDLAIEIWKELLNVSGYNKKAIEHLAKLDKKNKPKGIEIIPENTICGIILGMPEDSVHKKLGEPDEEMGLEKMRALEYVNKKMVIFIRNGKVSGILAQPGFLEKTSKGIGIGSLITELHNAYGAPDDIIQQKDVQQWVYNKYGLLFNVYDDKVTQFQIVEALEDL